MNSITAVLICRNEKIFLSLLIPRLKKLVDRIIVVDMESTDGSVELLKDNILATHDILVNYKREDLFRYGYAHARNYGANFAESDWIISVDADEFFVTDNNDVLRILAAETIADVLSFECRELIASPIDNLEKDFEFIDVLKFNDVSHQRRMHRNINEIRWEGLIHEELYRNNVSCFENHIKTDLYMNHYSGFRTQTNQEEKRQLYSYLILKGGLNISFQLGTNRFWYNRHLMNNFNQIFLHANDFCKNKDLPLFDKSIALKILSAQFDLHHLNVTSG